jgi:glycosyltransferase involved in cell wall biosynthesis
MPDFSIIIPSFNRANKLPKAINSVLNQTFSNWELIVVDDGSTDQTRNIVKLNLDGQKVKYVYQAHSGVSDARNVGLNLASADYIIFLDSDDELSPNLLEDLMEHKYNNFDIIFWEVKKNLGDKIQIWKPRKLEKIYNYIRGSFLSGSLCYRKEILLKAGGFDPLLSFGENYELGMRVAQLDNLKTTIIPDVYLTYHVNQEFRPHSEPATKLASLEYLLQKHKKNYEKDNYSHSRLLYQMGYLNEKLNQKGKAYRLYKKAQKVNSLYLKPILKILFLKAKGIPS